MRHFDILKKADVNSSARTAYVCGVYGIKKEDVTEHFEGDFDLPEKWNIGLIYGRSGSGKTTIAREMFLDGFANEIKDKNTPVINLFPENMEIAEIEKLLVTCGFGSVPCWLKPYAVLSEGEKMRVDMAYCLAQNKKIICVDEFTSTVDRNTAHVIIASLNKTIKTLDKKVVLISCHADVKEWAELDWIFDTNTMSFEKNPEFKKKSKSSKLDKFSTPDKNRNYGEFLANITI